MLPAFQQWWSWKLGDDVPDLPSAVSQPSMVNALTSALLPSTPVPDDIEGAILPGVDGDELWRATAVKTRFVLRRRFDAATGNESITCVDLETEEPCDAWTHAVLLSPPTNRWLPMFFRKLLLQMPAVIVPEFVGPHRLVHCTGQ